MDLEKYERARPYGVDAPEIALDRETLDTLWALFQNIGWYWKTVDDVAPMKSRWRVFLDNRIRTDPAYAIHYKAGARLLREMLDDLGDDAYAYLFTSAAAAQSPPTTPLARLRQLISNEFIDLHLALGGFQSFGAKNLLGYISGPNQPGRPAPYRTAEDRS